jgi:hypothetical protein
MVALSSRVNSDMNTNAIWEDDQSIIDSYKLLVTSEKDNTQYHGSFCPIVAAFDKMSIGHQCNIMQIYCMQEV